MEGIVRGMGVVVVGVTVVEGGMVGLVDLGGGELGGMGGCGNNSFRLRGRVPSSSNVVLLS